MSLGSYSANSWIRRHVTSADEIGRLLAVADRDIEQSQVEGLNAEWRFDIAYNAALQAATAALAAAGYRAERQNKHMRTIECLAFSVGLPANDVDLLDRFRRKRHRAVYEQVGAITDGEAGEMLELAKRLRALVETWLRQNHADLLHG